MLIKIRKTAVKFSKKINNVKGNGILVFFMITCFLNFANTNPIRLENKNHIYSFTNLEEGDVLTILNENGSKLYKEKIEEKNYNLGFNLTNLKDGDYIFELDKGLMISSIPFTVSMNRVTFFEENEKIIYKPHFRVRNKTVFLTKLCFNPEVMVVNVYFKSKDTFQLIHREHIENIQGVEKIFKLRALKKGAYKIVAIDTDGREFSKIIEQL